MAFQGSCHCGKVGYTVDEDAPAQALVCNCSICRRKGGLLHAASPKQVRLRAAVEDLQTYTFGRHKFRHQFCTTCGCAPFAWVRISTTARSSSSICAVRMGSTWMP